MMKRNTALLLWILPVISGAVFFLLWQLGRDFLGVSAWLLPTPSEIFSAALHERATLFSAALSTGTAALFGFLAASLVGFTLAVLLGTSRLLHASFYPYLLVLQMTPVIVLAPILQLWLGPGLPGIVMITFLVSFFPVVVNATQGLISVDRNQVDLFRVAGATRLQELWRLRIPSALPHYFSGIRIAAALAPVGTIFGEYLVGNSSGGTGGLGFRIYAYNTQINTPALFATAFVSCALGFLFVAAITALNHFALRHWHESIERSDA